LLAWYAATMFLSAGLLFMVQPMIAKMALPLLGGSPAVWIACMLFFQTSLLAAYAYAHAAPRWFGERRQMLAHGILLALPFALLPLGLHGWQPPSTMDPAFWLLGMLTVVAGLPFFAVAATAPLLQHWFAGSGHHRAADPYFLYAASNAGSMGAVLAYPLIVEPHLRLAIQSYVWGAGYLLLAAMIGACVVARLRSTASAPVQAAPGRTLGPSALLRARWLILAFVPSSLMLGVTSYITTDIAPVPLLWMAPLALYLLTFIIAFGRYLSLAHTIAVSLLPVGIVALLAAGILDWNPDITTIITLHLTVFFIAALVCHTELAQRRPDPVYLTEYYLWIATGGALGGVFNAILAPKLFNRVLEYPLVVVLVCFLRPRLTFPTPRPRKAPGQDRSLTEYTTLAWGLFGVFAGILFYFLSYHGDWSPEALKHIERSFFGVLSVRRDARVNCLNLQHGTTIHGVRSLDPGRASEPLAYFSRTGPIGQIFSLRPTLSSVGIIGLGAGTLACYAQPGQDWTFYEIDPAVERIARNPEWFTFLRDAESRGVRLKTILGDGRLRLARTDERYDLFIIDAFSSDSIPVHLLTVEAIKLYQDHLRPGGWLIFHISSEYLRLAPVLAALARSSGLQCLYQEDFKLTPADYRMGKLPSQWAVLISPTASSTALARDDRWRQPTTATHAAWSDDYSNILEALGRRELPRPIR
jgi:spermidine synthase